MILDWKVTQYKLQFDGCFSLNFGYHDHNLIIPQFAMTPESDIELNFDSPIGCLFVMIGGKYLNRIGDVMEKVNSVTNGYYYNVTFTSGEEEWLYSTRGGMGGIRPLAVFLISDNYKENVFIDINYGFERYKHSPVMVKRGIAKPNFICEVLKWPNAPK